MPDENGNNTSQEGTGQEGNEQPRNEMGQFQTNSDGSEYLKDAGKRALDSMKEERNAARQEAKDAKAEADRLKAEQAGEKEKYEQQQRDQQVKDDALKAANERIVKASVRERAATKLADPADALLHLDVSGFEVGSDGEVDTSKIDQAIDSLTQNKPYLAAQSGRTFQGSADGGTRNGNAGAVQQLTREDLSALSPQQIVQAKSEGRLNEVLGRS